MDQCRHDELTVTVGVETDTGNIVDVVYCSNPACDVDARAIIADICNQRDAARNERDAANLALGKSQTQAAKLFWTAKYISRALRSLRHVKLDGIAEQYGLRTNGDWLGLFLDATDAHVQALGELATQRERAAAAEKRAAAAEAEVERQKAVIEALLLQLSPVCRRCGCSDGCPHQEDMSRDGHYNCMVRIRAWAYGETKEGEAATIRCEYTGAPAPEGVPETCAAGSALIAATWPLASARTWLDAHGAKPDEAAHKIAVVDAKGERHVLSCTWEQAHWLATETVRYARANSETGGTNGSRQAEATQGHSGQAG